MMAKQILQKNVLKLATYQGKTFLFCVLVSFLSSCNMAQKTDYIFPRNFNGWCAIIYNVSNGSTAEYVNGRSINRLPNSGILLLKEKRPEGILNNRYYRIGDTTLEVVYSSSEDVPIKSNFSSYIEVFSYQSIGINGRGIICDKIEKDNNQLINLTEVVIIKVATKHSHTQTYPNSDLYWESIESQVIKLICQ